MEWSGPKSCGPTVASMILCSLVVVVALMGSPTTAAPADHHHQLDRDPGTADGVVEEEAPRRPAAAAGYQPGMFPFNRGQPFVMDPADTAAHQTGHVSGFDANPPSSRSDDYYDYDAAKLEQVPFDYRGDPIDRKDVHPEPGSVRPNDIRPANKNAANNDFKLPADIYQYLNLPKQYSSSDKFPLMSSSYANTKVQGSGSSSSSLSNHKMPPTAVTASPSPTTAAAAPSWYSPTAKTAAAVPVTTTTTTTSTTTTVAPPPSQEYEEYDYNDYGYHPQEPATPSTTTSTSTSTSTTARTTTSTTRSPPPPPPPPSSTTTTTAATTTVRRNPTSVVTPEPATATAANSALSFFTAADATSPSATTDNVAPNKTAATTTSRPEIDSKLDGTSFADYDTVRPASADKPAQHQDYSGQSFKPLPGNYQFDDKTYPLITANSKVPMTFTAHVSSGLSLNQKDHRPAPAAPVPEPVVYSSRPETQDYSNGQKGAASYETARPTASGGRPAAAAPEQSPTYYKPKPPKPSAGTDQLDAVYYKVRPDAYAPQQYAPSAVPPNRHPANTPSQNRPYQPEPPVLNTAQADVIRKPANAELQTSQGRPQQPYPTQSDGYTKNKPQYVPPQQSQPDTSKFKPPKHVINHFIKTLPDEDNKSYALQTSFSIGMDGERTETRPGQGVGQVLMVKDSSSEAVVNQTVPVMKMKPTTSVPLVLPPRPVQKPQQYPRPSWENIPKPSSYYPAPPPKRDSMSPPPPQRPSLPNILPQFRPNAKVDAPPMAPPQSHSATIERVQIPIDHLRPPPLPKPQFLKVDRNDDNTDEEILDIPEKETRILQRTGPQPAKVTTLQMIQHGTPTKIREDNQENPVHVIYASNNPPKPVEKVMDDSVILDVKDRSDVPILKTKTMNKPIKTDFPYQIVKPDENQNTSLFEYNAYSPTKSDTVKPNNDQELVPNLQDYVPVVTRDSASNIILSQKPITATLKTSEDNHKVIDEGHKPLLQNFQIPFQPSLKLPENSNGWSVVRKSQTDNVSERIDESSDMAISTEKFDPDNFKPHLVGGFMPINSPLEETKEKKTVEHSDRAKNL